MSVINSAESLIGCDEGDVGKPYQDGLGIWTVAKGHNLEANGLPAGIFTDAPDGMAWPECLPFLQNRGGVTPDEDAALFQYDLHANGDWLLARPWWANLNPPRQAAMLDMAFNLGPASMQTFTTFLGLIGTGLYDDAANDLEFKTKVAKQLPHRYGRLEAMLRTGQWPS